MREPSIYSHNIAVFRRYVKKGKHTNKLNIGKSAKNPSGILIFFYVLQLISVLLYNTYNSKKANRFGVMSRKNWKEMFLTAHQFVNYKFLVNWFWSKRRKVKCFQLFIRAEAIVLSKMIRKTSIIFRLIICPTNWPTFWYISFKISYFLLLQ